MEKKVKKSLLMVALISFCLGAIGAFVSIKEHSYFTKASGDINALVISPSNKVTDGYVRTNKGSNIYIQDDGVSWNGSNLTFENGGYIQNLTVIHGIQSVSVELVSGSLDLYHGYEEPTNLESPMYGVDYTFSSSSTYSFISDLPNRIRLRASEASVISSITILYDCQSANVDLNAEDLDDGLENSYIDAGPIAKYATTAYSLDTASESSSRSLKVTYKGTTNDYAVLSPEKNVVMDKATSLPDFRNAIFTLKAKFSSNIDNKNISFKPIGESWQAPAYLVMDCSNVEVNGWYTYSFDLSNVNFPDNDKIIRINLLADGITSANKSTAYVLFDEIGYSYQRYGRDLTYETINDGLENMFRDTGMENTYVSFDNEVTYGRNSKSSLVARPKESIGNNDYYYIVLSPEGHDGFDTLLVSDMSKGTLMFEYKPVSVRGADKIYFFALESWSSYIKKTATCTELRNGWYLCSFDLSLFGFTSPNLIRLKIGFDVAPEKVSEAKVYFDNIRVLDTPREDYTQGLENLYQDSGMSGFVSSAVDYKYTASSASLNSMKYTLKGNTSGWQSNRGIIFVIDDSELTQMTCNSGIFEAKFLFSSEFTTKEVWLNLVDSHWTGARFKGIIPEAIGDGWYQIRIDFSTLETWPFEKMETNIFDYTSHPIRLGFSFPDAANTGNNNINVWVDDIFYYPATTMGASDPIVWQAYSTENIRRDDDVIANRSITSSSPLKFSDARNGTDSTQLMLKARSNVSSYNFRPGSLRGSNGDILPATSFEVLIAKYLYVSADNPSHNGESGQTGHMGSGYYPDALVPIDRIIKANENTLTNGYQQSIWINCEIPIDQTPGTYEGYGILTIDGVDYSIPMKVVVYNATLSGANHNKTTFFIWYEKVQLAEPVYSREMRQIYYDFLLEKGISGNSNHDWSRWAVGDLDQYDSFADNFANYIMPNKKISTYQIPAEATQESITNYLSALVSRNIVEWNKGNHVNFFDKAIIILADEPTNPKWNDSEPQAWKNCKSIQTYIKNAVSSLSSSLNEYPEIRDGLNDIRNVVTIGCDYDRITGGSMFYKDLLNTDYIGVPCPQFSKVDNANERETYQSRFNHCWFYGCSNPQLPYPSYHMDTPLLGQRLITWMQYNYGFEGTLYFCTDMYTTTDQNNELRDVWTDPMVGQFAGDGQLTYPGTRYNVFGPITSMRLENIRNSMEDYEYFYLLDHNIGAYNANTGSSISSCKDLLTSEFLQMFNGTKLLSRGHTSDSGYKAEDFDSIRTYLLERLEYCC